MTGNSLGGMKQARATNSVCSLPRLRSLHPRRKQLVGADHARGETLLVHVAADRLESRAIGFESIGPEIGAKHPPRFFDVIDQPRQRNAQRIGVVEATDRKIARFDERAVDAARRTTA